MMSGTEGKRRRTAEAAVGSAASDPEASFNAWLWLNRDRTKARWSKVKPKFRGKPKSAEEAQSRERRIKEAREAFEKSVKLNRADKKRRWNVDLSVLPYGTTFEIYGIPMATDYDEYGETVFGPVEDEALSWNANFVTPVPVDEGSLVMGEVYPEQREIPPAVEAEEEPTDTWTMTRDEIVASLPEDDADAALSAHAELVQEAYDDGQTIPQKVLDELAAEGVNIRPAPDDLDAAAVNEAAAPVEPELAEPATPDAPLTPTTQRQPWQMTLDEFQGRFEIRKDDYGGLPWHAYIDGKPVMLYKSGELKRLHADEAVPPAPDQAINFKRKQDVVSAIKASHRLAVQEAQRRGQAVPLEVLAPYRDLEAPPKKQLFRTEADGPRESKANRLEREFREEQAERDGDTETPNMFATPEDRAREKARREAIERQKRDDTTNLFEGGFLRLPKGKKPPRVVGHVEVRPGVYRTNSRSEVPRGASMVSETTVDGETYWEYRMPSGDGKLVTREGTTLDEAMQWQDEEVEAAYGAKEGARPEGIRAKLKDMVVNAFPRLTRAQLFLPNDSPHASINEGFRLLKAIPEVQRENAIRLVRDIIDPLSDPELLKLFQRRIIVDNMLDSLEHGESKRFRIKNRQQMLDMRDQLERLIDGLPQPDRLAVRDALDNRLRIITETVNELIDYGVVPESYVGRVMHYFHQQVDHNQELDRVLSTLAGPRPAKRGFMRRRVKEIDLNRPEFDYNTSYLESEADWLTQALVELEKAKWLRRWVEPMDVLPELKREAKRRNYETAVGGPEVVEQIEKLRELIRSSPGNTPTAIQIRRDAVDTLWKIDPTYQMRIKIAYHSASMRKFVENLRDVMPANLYNAITRDVPGMTDVDSTWHRAVNWLAHHHPDHEAGMHALGIFKWIDARNKKIMELAGDQYVTWSNLRHENPDLAEWQPVEGNVFYRAFSIPEKFAEQIMEALAKEEGLEADQLEVVRQVVALGGPKRQFVLPREVAAQLEWTGQKVQKNWARDVSRAVMSAWKFRTILGPDRALAYMARNFTGDMDAVVAGNPGVLKYLKSSYEEVLLYHKGSLELSDDLREALEYAVINSSITARELPDVKELQIFRRYLGHVAAKRPIPARLVRAYVSAISNFNEGRENWLRLAAYKYFKDRLAAGEPISHYGGAKKKIVDALVRDQGPEIAAAHLSRNLLGDYGNLTVFGEWMKQHGMPFWSFQEINIKRYPRMFINAMTSGMSGKQKGLHGAKLLASGSGRIMYNAVRTVRLEWFYGFCWLWNHMMYPWFYDDDENAYGLTPAERQGNYDRSNPGLLLKPLDENQTVVFRNLGALGDFLEWTGANDLAVLYPQYRDDQLGLQHLATEMLKAPVNKLVGAVRPDVKGAAEILMGQSIFPDVFNARRADRGEVAAQIFGLRDEYRIGKGLLTRDGSRARPGFLVRKTGLGVTDARRNALYNMYDLRAKFLERKGNEKDAPPMIISPFKNLREAAMADNFNAFLEARRDYMKEGKGYNNFKSSLRHLDPIAARLSDADEREFEQEFLNDTQRRQLAMSRDYAQSLRVKLWQWWQNAAAIEDDPYAQWELNKTLKHDVALKGRVLSQKRPLKRSSVPDWNARRKRAEEWLEERGITESRAKSAWTQEQRRR